MQTGKVLRRFTGHRPSSLSGLHARWPPCPVAGWDGEHAAAARAVNRERRHPASEGAFVLLGGKGVAERKFDTLAEAVQGASDGDTIEIRGNGPFVTRIRVQQISSDDSSRRGLSAGDQVKCQGRTERFAFVQYEGQLVLEGLDLFRPKGSNPG